MWSLYDFNLRIILKSLIIHCHNLTTTDIIAIKILKLYKTYRRHDSITIILVSHIVHIILPSVRTFIRTCISVLVNTKPSKLTCKFVILLISEADHTTITSRKVLNSLIRINSNVNTIIDEMETIFNQFKK